MKTSKDFKIGDTFWDTENVSEEKNSKGEVIHRDITYRYIVIENVKNGIYLIRAYTRKMYSYWDEPLTKDSILTREELVARYKYFKEDE